ncbi:MAG: phosphotransferase [Planctomycetes bacterium]|nr:phosphotransferase [Planctomycetota bacterium]
MASTAALVGPGPSSARVRRRRLSGNRVGAVVRGVVCHPDESFLGLLALRADELGLDSFRSACIGGSASFPFSDDSFDAVVVKAGLASVGWPVPSVELLRETRRILRRSGCLVLQAENRWALCGGTLDFAMRVAGARPSRSRDHTRIGYGRLLRRAGFESVRFCEPFRQPTVSGQDDRLRRLKKQLQRRSWFTESFNILAATERLDEGWVGGLTAHVAREIGLKLESGSPPTRLSGGQSSGLILYLDRQCVLRVPLEPNSGIRVAKNFEGLAVARDSVRPGVPVRTPGPLLADSYDGVDFTVESHLEGRTLDQIEASERAVVEERMFELLLALKRLNTVEAVPTEPGTSWSEQVVQPLLRAVSWAETRGQRQMATEVAQRAADVDASCIPHAFSHGDFKWGNMLVADPDTGVALVDWDRWRARDLVSHDFLHFLCNRRKLRDRCAWPEAFGGWLDGVGMDEPEHRWTRRFAEEQNLGPGWELAGGLAYWARDVASSAGTVYDLYQGWIRRTFMELLPRVHEKLIRIP